MTTEITTNNNYDGNEEDKNDEKNGSTKVAMSIAKKDDGKTKKADVYKRRQQS